MATLKDVAKLAGVSYNTVSLVINNVNKVAPETKEKVLRAIKELNYKPNKIAKALVSGRADSIAFISTRFSSVVGMNILREIEEGVYLAGLLEKYDLIPFSTRGNIKLKEQIIDSIISSRKADVIIMLGMKLSDEYLKKIREKKISLILIDEYIEGVHSVKSDNFNGAYNATMHLLNKGRKKLVYLGEKQMPEKGLSIYEKVNGFKKAISDFGREIKVSYFSVENNFINDGYTAGRNIINEVKDMDAIFCAAGDNTAIGVMKAVKEAGIKIPDDIAIIGYDDIPVASAISPALTTVKQPFEKIGNEAFAIALEEIQGKIKQVKNFVFETEFIKRDSA